MEFDTSMAIGYLLDAIDSSKTHYNKWRPCVSKQPSGNITFYMNDYFDGVKVQAYPDRTIFEFSHDDSVISLDKRIYKAITEIKKIEKEQRHNNFMKTLKEHYTLDWKL